MKPKHLFVHILAVLFAIPLAGTVAQAATIDVIETFDYPGSFDTQPQKINGYGVIAGVFVDSATGATEGFYRSRGGQFSDPVVDPNDDSFFTQVRGINDRRTICGNYNTSDGISHGFFRAPRGTFADYDISSTFTVVLGINNAGDFSGSFIDDADGVQKGFVSIGGTVTGFAVPVATNTLAYQINASNEATGYYIGDDGLTHGYLRDSSGNLTFPIDPAGSTGTILFGNNDSNWVVGRYSDASGITHGLFFMTPDDFVIFDFPGAAGFTSLNGINQQGYICGRYLDANANEHGFLAKVNPHAASQPSHNNPPLAPVKPAKPTPEAIRNGVPAS